MGNMLMEDPHIFIDQTVKAIRVLRCPSERVVELAAYQLGGWPEQWYRFLWEDPLTYLHSPGRSSLSPL